MALADILEARKQAQAVEAIASPSTALVAGERHLSTTAGPILSQDSQQVLNDAWMENQMHAYGAPIDTADLLIGLLQAPKTSMVLDHFGIDVERVRNAKRDSYGYQLATRFNAVADKKLTKTQQVGRVARLVAEVSMSSGKGVIEPEDILEILAMDGLGWGMGIMEELGLNEALLREGLSNVYMLGDGMFAMSAPFLARRREADAAALRAARSPIARIGRIVGRILAI